MSKDYPNLFSPLRVNNTILKNRVIATPVGDPYLAAKGGPAVAITHSVGVDLPNAMWGDYPYAFSKYELEKTKHLLNQIHSAGALASIEIMHCGNQAKPRAGVTAWGPCDYVNDDGIHIKAMTEEEMEIVADAYAKTAKDAQKIGFDILFLHFAHGWLPAQFLSPLHNHRTDEYGGSLENLSLGCMIRSNAEVGTELVGDGTSDFITGNLTKHMKNLQKRIKIQTEILYSAQQTKYNEFISARQSLNTTKLLGI